jgi:hypothetical protein
MIKKLEPNNLGVYVCPHVFEKTRPILYVCRDDGDWQFLCGGYDHVDDEGHLVGVGHLVERDPTLNELADLKPNWEAERDEVGGKWIYSECKPE